MMHPNIDPIAFSIGPLSVHWYGLTYLASFGLVWALALYRARRPFSPIRSNQVEDMIFYGAVGVILGGRIGSALFYNLDRFLADPLWIFRVWEGGMAFHGGLLGVIVAMWVYGFRRHIHYLDVTDFIAPLAPVGLFFGRIGNFIGQELWGRPTEGWWGMIFPADPLGLLRHPSQLYEAALEGLVLFAMLFWMSRYPRRRGAISALFLIFYSLFRFVVEFAREPDAHIGLQWFGWMTRGQILCLPMFIFGVLLMIYAFARPSPSKSHRVSE